MFIDNFLNQLDRGYEAFLIVFLTLLGIKYVIATVSSIKERRNSA